DLAPDTARQTFVVAKGVQVVGLTPTPNSTATVGDTYTFTTTGGKSGNPVDVTTTNNDVCMVKGDTVSFFNPGSCVSQPDQAGNADYEAGSYGATVNVIAPQTADLSVTADNEGDQGNFTRVNATVHGLPQGASALLTVSPEGNYALKPVDDKGACQKD